MEEHMWNETIGTLVNENSLQKDKMWLISWQILTDRTFQKCLLLVIHYLFSHDCFLFFFCFVSTAECVSASSADSDPGFILGRRYQLWSHLQGLSLQWVQLQLSHQGAEHDRRHRVGKSVKYRGLENTSAFPVACFFMKEEHVRQIPELWTRLIPRETEQAKTLPGWIILKSIRVKPEGHYQDRKLTHCC